MDSVTFLGIIINENLSWKPHIQFLCNKISKAIGIIYKVKNIFPVHTLINLYNAFILPHLQYGNVIWGNYYSTHIEKLHKLHKLQLD